MDVNTDDLAAFLNLAWENAQSGANTLPKQLLAEQIKAVQLIATGSIASVGKNSANQSYAFYGPGALTQRQITNIFTTLLRYYQTVKDKITAAATAADPAVVIPGDFDFDGPVYDVLVKFLQVSAQVTVLPDITQLRFPIGAINDATNEEVFA